MFGSNAHTVRTNRVVTTLNRTSETPDGLSTVAIQIKFIQTRRPQ